MTDTIILRFDFINCETIRTRCTIEAFDANVDTLSFLHRNNVVTVEVDTGQTNVIDMNRPGEHDMFTPPAHLR